MCYNIIRIIDDRKVKNMENEEQVVKQEEKKKRPFDLTVKIYKIVSIVIYCIWTLFLGYLVISSKLDAENANDFGEALGYVFVLLIVIVIGLIGYGIMTVIGIVGLSMSIANKENPKRKGNIIFFSIETLMSVATYALLILYLSLGN